MHASREERIYVSLSRQLRALYCLLFLILLFQLASADSCHFIGYWVRLTNSLGANDEYILSRFHCKIAVGRYVHSLVCRLRNQAKIINKKLYVLHLRVYVRLGRLRLINKRDAHSYTTAVLLVIS